MLYEDTESHKLFIKLLDLVSEEKRLDVFSIYMDIRLLSNSPSWWLFLETNKLCKKIGQYKDIPNVQLDKAEILKFYSSASIVRSLYWCIMRIYENLFRLQNAAYTMSMIFEDWPNLVERFEKKEIDEKEFYYLIEEKYTTAHCVELNYIIPEIIAKIYVTELDMKNELETSFALEYIPDTLREKMDRMDKMLLNINNTTQNTNQTIHAATDKRYKGVKAQAEVIGVEKTKMNAIRKQNPELKAENGATIFQLREALSNYKPEQRSTSKAKK